MYPTGVYQLICGTRKLQKTSQKYLRCVTPPVLLLLLYRFWLFNNISGPTESAVRLYLIGTCKQQTILQCRGEPLLCIARDNLVFISRATLYIHTTGPFYSVAIDILMLDPIIESPARVSVFALTERSILYIQMTISQRVTILDMVNKVYVQRVCVKQVGR